MLPRAALGLLALISPALVYEGAGLNLGAASQDAQALEAAGGEADDRDPEEEESEQNLVARYGAPEFSYTSLHGSEYEMVATEREPNVPVINLDMNTNHNFEVLLSFIHYFRGGELPYSANIPDRVKDLWEKAKKFGSEIYVTAEYTRDKSRQDMLLNQMKSCDVKFGTHKDPDLWVIVTAYPTLNTLHLAAQQRWMNNEKFLLIAHKFELRADEESFKKFEKETNPLITPTHIRVFSNFSLWKNTLGLMPLAPRYIMPTFFPYNYTHRNGTSRLRDDNWIPQLCVHGTFARRSWQPLADVLKELPRQCPISVKIAGTGKYPRELVPHKGGGHLTLLRINSDLDYQNFFQQCDYLLPLMGDNTTSEYYHTKLLSSAARSIGHKIPVIAPVQFQKIYPMVQGKFFDGPTGFLDTVRGLAHCMTSWGS